MRVAALLLLAVATGFGGLLFEVACLRRTALLLGWGSVGQGLVLGAFLAGLGLGSRLLGGLPRLARRPLRSATLLYAIVALSLPFLYRALAALGPSADPSVYAACFGVPFAAAFAMGGAFPLLFPVMTAGRAGRGVGLLQGANLLGSVAGASLGAVVIVPRLGLTLAALIAAACYAIAVLLAVGARGAPLTAAGGDTDKGSLRSWLVVAASGFAVLGFELWLPRRLTFFLGGFLPTLAGTLVAALAGLALGSLLAELVLRRRTTVHLGAVALLAAVGCAASVVLVELVGPTLAGLPITSATSGLALASLAPLVVMLPATLPLGAILPLALGVRARHAELAAGDAGRGFFAFSLGALVAALVLPRTFDLPESLRLVPALAALPLALLAPRAAGKLAAAAVLAAAVAPFAGRFALEGARSPLGQARLRILAEQSDRITTASVVRDVVEGELLLYTDEFSAAGGLSSRYMRTLGLLPGRLAPDRGARVVICLGTGTTAAALTRASGDRRIEVVEVSPAVVALAAKFEAAARAWQPRATVHVADGRRWVETQPAASIAALTLEPLLPQAPGSVHLYSQQFYAAVARALRADGLCVQWVPTHALRPASYRSVVRTFVDAFRHVRAFLVDNSTLLVGAAQPFRVPETITGEDAYLTGLWRHDLLLSELSLRSARAALAGARIVTDDRPFLETEIYAPGREIASWLPQNLAIWLDAVDADPATLRLRACQRIAERFLKPLSLDLAIADLENAVAAWPRSTLLWRELREARAMKAEAAGLVALQSGRYAQAIESFRTAVLLGRARPVVLAGRAVALFVGGQRDEARRVLRDLRTEWPALRELGEIARRRHHGLGPLWDEPELAALFDEPAVRVEAGPPEELAKAWAGGLAWARHFQLRRPVLARWLLVTAVRDGLEVAPAKLRALFNECDCAALELLEPWLRPDRLRLLARSVAPDVPLPAWWEDLRDSIAGLATADRATWIETHRSLGFDPVPAYPETAALRRAAAAKLRADFVPPGR